MSDEQTWRVKRLQAAADRAGGNAKLGQRLGYKSGAQISHMLNGRRTITEKTVEKIERLRGFAGWFARPAVVTEPVGEYVASQKEERIDHAVKLLEAMESDQLDQAIRILDTLAQPIKRDGTHD